MSIITTVALLVLLTIPEVSGISPGDQGAIPRCRCITKEKKPIGRYIRKVVVNPANSYCNSIEIIATLRKDGQQICLDPHAPWLKKLLDRTRVKQTPRRTTLNSLGSSSKNKLKVKA